MSKAFECDNCGKKIGENDIRVVLNGYTVLHNQADARSKFQGYGIGHQDDFCSFTCLAQWAESQQGLLDDYLKLAAPSGQEGQ